MDPFAISLLFVIKKTGLEFYHKTYMIKIQRITK